MYVLIMFDSFLLEVFPTISSETNNSSLLPSKLSLSEGSKLAQINKNTSIIA